MLYYSQLKRDVNKMEKLNLQYFIKREKKSVIPYVFILVLRTASMSLMFFALGNFIDKLVGRDWASIKIAGILFLCVGITMQVLFYIESLLKERMIERINIDIRTTLDARILSLPYQKFMENEPSTYTSWLINDLARIESEGIESFASLMGGGLAVIINLISLFTINLGFGFFCLLLSLPNMLLPMFLKPKIEIESRIYSHQQEQFTTQVQSTYNGNEVTFAYNLYDWIRGKMNSYIKQMGRMQRKFKVMYATISVTSSLIFRLSSVATYFFLGYLFLTNAILVGTITVAGQFAALLYDGMNIFSGSGLGRMISTNALFDKYNKFFEDTVSNTHQTTVVEDKIAVENLGFTVNDNKIFTDFNYIFEARKKYLITGESGCGKTTLLKLLAGYLKPTTGEIILDNQVLENKIAASYISQSPYLFNDTLMNNIILNQAYDEQKLQNILKALQINIMVDGLENGLQTEIMENGKQFSGGQKQRITIARALYRGSNVLFVDEGTSALDKENAIRVDKLLLDLKDTMVISVSHKIEEHLQAQYDAVIVM